MSTASARPQPRVEHRRPRAQSLARRRRSRGLRRPGAASGGVRGPAPSSPRPAKSAPRAGRPGPRRRAPPAKMEAWATRVQDGGVVHGGQHGAGQGSRDGHAPRPKAENRIYIWQRIVLLGRYTPSGGMASLATPPAVSHGGATTAHVARRGPRTRPW